MLGVSRNPLGTAFCVGEMGKSVHSPLPLRVGDLTHGYEATSVDDLRSMLARELHDGIAQTLTTMLINLENFRMEQLGNQSVLREIAELQESTREVLLNLRLILYDLRGQTGIGEGFTEAVRALLDRFQDKTQLKVVLSVSPAWPPRLLSQAALNLHRIIEEALTNVRLHSGASLVQVALKPVFDGQFAVEVKDDGRGVETEAGWREPGLGLLGMRERASLLGGRLEVESVLGQGTTVRAIIPKEQLL
jgi:two-component system sensor histidine kinase UhpB